LKIGIPEQLKDVPSATKIAIYCEHDLVPSYFTGILLQDIWGGICADKINKCRFLSQR
jgi:hypothetical protein